MQCHHLKNDEEGPINISGLYYCDHIMFGLGTIFIEVMLLDIWYLWRKRLEVQQEKRLQINLPAQLQDPFISIKCLNVVLKI